MTKEEYLKRKAALDTALRRARNNISECEREYINSAPYKRGDHVEFMSEGQSLSSNGIMSIVGFEKNGDYYFYVRTTSKDQYEAGCWKASKIIRKI